MFSPLFKVSCWIQTAASCSWSKSAIMKLNVSNSGKSMIVRIRIATCCPSSNYLTVEYSILINNMNICDQLWWSYKWCVILASCPPGPLSNWHVFFAALAAVSEPPKASGSGTKIAENPLSWGYAAISGMSSQHVTYARSAPSNFSCEYLGAKARQIDHIKAQVSGSCSVSPHCWLQAVWGTTKCARVSFQGYSILYQTISLSIIYIIYIYN